MCTIKTARARALRPAARRSARVGGHRKVAIQPELNCSFSLQSCSCTPRLHRHCQRSYSTRLKEVLLQSVEQTEIVKYRLTCGGQKTAMQSAQLADIEIVHGWFTERSDSIRAS